MLRFAGREADIVGVNANLSAGDIGDGSVADVSWEKMEEKVGWVARGPRLRVATSTRSSCRWRSGCSRVTDDRAAGRRPAGEDGRAGSVSTSAGSTMRRACWSGSPARCIEKLHQMRDRLGISYVQVHAGPRGTDLPPSPPSSPPSPAPEVSRRDPCHSSFSARILTKTVVERAGSAEGQGAGRA